MKKNVVLVFVFVLSYCSIYGQKESVRKLNFNSKWKFNYGDVADASSQKFNDKDWKEVDLPHDWSIELGFSKGKSEGGIATGHTQGGIGWYRKNFTLSKADSGKLLQLYFEGIYMESEVWLNGKKISFQPYGYTSFFCDITKHLNPAGQENTVAVKTVNQGKNSRWYAGAGIYRNVWLITTRKLHLDTWGVFVQTKEASTENARINITADISNELNIDSKAQVTIQILDKSGKQVAENISDMKLTGGSKQTINQNITIPNPQLWSTDSPTLYQAEITVKSGAGKKDVLFVPFGIRTLSFSAEKGFLLNGKSIKLKGGCVHHDNGLLGVAAIDRAEDYKVELLKNNGFNAVRCSHNPPSEEFLNACDRRGLLVIDEAFDQWQKRKNPQDYHRFFGEWSEHDLSAMVLRDRNHPSIIMWSIGNEIQERSDSSGVAIAARLREIVRRYDVTRPVTMAVNSFWDNPKLSWKDSERAFRSSDVCGYNYAWNEYENDHKLYPSRVMFSTETLPKDRAKAWECVEKNPYVIGDFVWTAMDYLGESGIGHTKYRAGNEKNAPLVLDYPWFNGWCGDIDICGNKKPQAALRDVAWGITKIEILVHAPIPAGLVEDTSPWGWLDESASWNWSGFENQLMAVKVITRYPSVRLYLNDKLLDEKPVEMNNDVQKMYAAFFQVPYVKGELKATGVENGIEKESIVLKTTGKPFAIRLIVDRSEIRASRSDLSYVHVEVVDKDGNCVPDHDVKLQINVSGNGEIAASGNACPTDMESFRSLTPKTYKGRALVILRPKGKAGKIVLHVNSDELRQADAVILTK
jgi:beta-galactosidase